MLTVCMNFDLGSRCHGNGLFQSTSTLLKDKTGELPQLSGWKASKMKMSDGPRSNHVVPRVLSFLLD